ncbi:hypothetical protein H0H92_001178 [Tricholoma furcatifolium]|nr:hypothetical protein H0H92_001178 [Tricholoma furcatifolium]
MGVPVCVHRGTTLLMTLPLGAMLCFFDLLGAQAFVRGEVPSPLAYTHNRTALPTNTLPLPAVLPPTIPPGRKHERGRGLDDEEVE